MARRLGGGRNARKVGPSLPPLPSVPSLARAARTLPAIRGPRGAIVRDIQIQPTFEEYRASALYARTGLTQAEYLAYWALTSSTKAGLFLREGRDFKFQKAELGYETFNFVPGSTKVDFVITRDIPHVALPVQGTFWHPLVGEDFGRDLSTFRRLRQQLGYVVVPLMEEDLLRDAGWLVREAVLYHNDHSPYRGLI